MNSGEQWLTVTVKVAVCVCSQGSPLHPPTPKQTLPYLLSALTHTHTQTQTDTHTHCTAGVHTHRAPPCFPSAVSALLFTMPSHLSSPTGKTLIATTSWTIHPSSTLWLCPASRLYLSPSLTSYQRPRPLHAPRPHPPPLSKGGAKSKLRLRCISAIYFDFWKDLRIHRCCVHYSSTFRQWRTIVSAVQS